MQTAESAVHFGYNCVCFGGRPPLRLAANLDLDRTLRHELLCAGLKALQATGFPMRFSAALTLAF
eukprot:scaffold156888_cov47-Prasinocladus_malaysianus.AAC.1